MKVREHLDVGASDTYYNTCDPGKDTKEHLELSASDTEYNTCDPGEDTREHLDVNDEGEGTLGI